MENATKEQILKELFTHFNKGITDVYEKGENNKEIYNSFKYDENTNIHKFELHGIEYCLLESEDEAERIAIDRVKDDLEDSPEMFTQTWLQEFIYISDMDKNCMCNDEEDNIREMVTEDTNIDNFENEEEMNASIDEIVETRLKEYKMALDDPIEYFVNEQGIYTIEDLFKQYWINIDIDEASKDAINIDGWAHFLSHYDGNYDTTTNGLVYFRDC